MNFKWVAYAFAVGIWDTLITGIIVAICNIVYLCSGKPTTSIREIITTYILGYALLFVLSTKIVDEE